MLARKYSAPRHPRPVRLPSPRPGGSAGRLQGGPGRRPQATAPTPAPVPGPGKRRATYSSRRATKRSTMSSPRNVSWSFPSTKTGATGSSNVPGQADPDVGVLALARPVHDAAHHGDPEVLHAGVGLAPLGHARP